jgi:hypothetical protein
MNDVEKLIERCFIQWKNWYGILSVRISTKFVKGEDTGIPSITFYVIKKEEEYETSNGHFIRSNKPIQLIPKEIAGIPTDVVELNTPDYILGSTSVSNQSPDEQKRKASGVKKE